MRGVSDPEPAEAAAYNCNPLTIDILPCLQIIDGRGKSAFCARFLAEARVFPRPGHIDRERRQAFFVKQLTIASAIFLPAIDSAPMDTTGGRLVPLGICRYPTTFFPS